MTLDFNCDGCGQKYRVDVSLSGRQIRCKKCGEPVTVPSPNAVARTALTNAPAANPSSRAPLKSFGEPPRPKALPQSVARPRDEEEYDYDMSDAVDAADEVEDAYGIGDEYAPPRRSADDDEHFVRPGRLGSLDPNKSKNMRPAGVWKRFCAAVIDMFLCSFIYVASCFCLGVCLGIYYAAVLKKPLVSDDVQMIVGFWNLIYIGLMFLYSAGLNCSYSQGTAGKAAMGIKVTDLDGRRISFLRSAGRTLASPLCMISLSIGFFMSLVTERKQAIHDMISGTQVVEK